MRSTFVQLWLAFVMVMLLTLGAASAVTYAIAVKRASQSELVSPATLATSAQQALSQGGPDRVASWSVAEAHRQPELQIYFVDAGGHEMLSRKVRGEPISASVGRTPPLIRAPDGTVYQVLVRRTRNVVFDLWNIFLRPWVFAVVALGVSGVCGAWLAWRLSRPVRRLRASVRAVAGGDLEVQPGRDLTARRDELGGLARDFGQMTRDLRSLISSKEELLRDVSHELRSPLARLRLAADLARRRGADSAEAFERIDREVERIDGMIGQILRFSRLGAGPTPARDPVELGELLAETVEEARIEADSAGVELRLTADGPTWVAADRTQLRSAVENVLRNALRYSQEDGQVEVRLTRSLQEARIEISDSGPGLREAELVRVFEPFHRGEGSDGVGLGLAITHRILELHGGRAAARNLPRGGLRVELALPRSGNADRRRDVAAVTGAAAASG